MIADYLIEQAWKDWSEYLSPWAGLISPSFTVWFVNRFGDIIVVLDDGSVHLLDVGVGTFDRIAADREEFLLKIDQDENANDWLMIPFVDACVAAGMILGPNQCYGYRMPPMLGGGYEIGNFVPLNIAEHYSFLADIWQQAKDIPDGTPVEIVVERS